MAEIAVRQTVNVPDRVQILGFPIDRVTISETTKIIESYLSAPQDEKVPTKLIFTADSNAFVSAANDDEFRRLFREASLITPDSAGPVWALKRLGKPVAGRVSGVDLVESLCELSAKHSASIYFLGSAPGVAASAVENLKGKYPGMVVAGVRDGYFSKNDDQIIAEAIAETKPDILVVAMGMPRQELFILDNATIIRAKIGIGVGGSLDVHSGTVKRAPKVIQKLHLEWMWRLLLNPKKFAKVKNLPAFYLKVRRSKPL